MPYAITNSVSQARIDAGIEISETEYLQAIQAIQEGLRVVVKNDELHFLSNEKQTVYDVVDDSELEIFQDDVVPEGYSKTKRPAKHYIWKDGEWYEDPGESLIRKKQELTEIVRDYLDTEANKKGYDSVLSLCSYATSNNKVFALEGQAGVDWRDSVWGYFFEQLDKIDNGSREFPSTETLIKELPKINLPTK